MAPVPKLNTDLSKGKMRNAHTSPHSGGRNRIRVVVTIAKRPGSAATTSVRIIRFLSAATFSSTPLSCVWKTTTPWYSCGG